MFAALTKTERVVFGVAALALLGAASALAALALGRATTVVPAQGGTFTEGVLGQPTYANPILAESDADKNLVRLLFASVLDLAEKTEADQSGRVWKLRLKEGIKWSDGRKITSDDVIFTVQKMQDPETRSPLYASWQGVAANRLSEIEVQFNLVSPYPFFIENLRALYPIPKHLFADTPSSNWRLSDYNLKPVGSGPYAFKSYQKEESGFISVYELGASPNYAGDQPYISTMSFRYFGNIADLTRAFNAGVLDAFGEFDPDAVTRVNRSYEVVSFPVPSYYAVFLNQGQSLVLKELVVRQALAGSIDRAQLILGIFGARAREVQSPVFGEEGSLNVASSGLENTPIALESAGWIVGESGIREKTVKDVVLKLQFDLVVPKISFLEKTAGLLRDMWRRAGIEVNLVVLAPEEITNRVIKNREYQAILFGNFLNPPHDLYPFWHSNERFYPGLNLALYNSEDADELMEAIRRELDVQKRASEIHSLAETIAQDVPAAFLYSPDYLYVVSRDVKGIEPKQLAEPADRYEGVLRWHLKTTRALK
jgi:peptide/nickel transport system substrate-binding protein